MNGYYNASSTPIWYSYLTLQQSLQRLSILTSKSRGPGIVQKIRLTRTSATAWITLPPHKRLISDQPFKTKGGPFYASCLKYYQQRTKPSSTNSLTISLMIFGFANGTISKLTQNYLLGVIIVTNRVFIEIAIGVYRFRFRNYWKPNAQTKD